MHPLLNLAMTAARQAGDLMMRYRDRIDSLKISQKSANDFVSEVDVMVEQAIIKTLSKAYPDHGFIAEESGISQHDAESLWIIDPLDGTNNYLHGFPFFCVSIAHMVKNKIEHGVIYDPLRQECFVASRGNGAQLNDRRIRVSKTASLSSALLGTTFDFNDDTPNSLQALTQSAVSIRHSGAAALELAYVAAGRLDGFIGADLKCWDLAAGALLIQEAGGMVSDFSGAETYLKSGKIIAAPLKVFKPIVQAFHAEALNDR